MLVQPRLPRKRHFNTEVHKGHGKCDVLLYYVFEKRESEEVVGHVSRIEHESAIGAALLSSCQGDLTILHHLITPVHLTDHTHRLCRIGFLHHLGTQKTICAN